MSEAVSASARTLATIVARSSAASLARSLECDESAVRAWARGRRKPTAGWRERLAAFDPQLTASGWDEAPGEAAPVALASAAPALTPSPVPSAPGNPPEAPHVPSVPAVGGEAALLEVIRQCNELYAEAAKPGAHASVRDRTAILAAKSAAVIRLSRTRGEDAISLRKTLESAWWRRVEAVLSDVLGKAPGGPLEEIGRRLRALEAGAGGGS
jgi:hypothetical protein